MTVGALRAVMPNDVSRDEVSRDGHDRLLLLLELTNSLVSRLELRDVLAALARSTGPIMRSDSVVVALPDGTRHLRACVLDDTGDADLLRENGLIGGDGTVAAHVFRTGQ